MLRTLAAQAARAATRRPAAWAPRSTGVTPKARASSNLFHVPDGPVGFVFDIDGVLIRGSEVLPQGRRALASLYSEDGQTPRYPVVLLTNGGGVTEAKRAERLSKQLGVRITERQLVQSHTPMRRLVRDYGDEPVLVLGRGEVAGVARSYGFKHVLGQSDLVGALPGSLPFWPKPTSGDGGPGAAAPRKLPPRPIAAVLFFHDPSDWYGALQLTLDVVLGHGVPTAWRAGVLGSTLFDPASGAADPGEVAAVGAPYPGGAAPTPLPAPPPVVFSHRDLLWVADHPSPRIAQGALGRCLSALHAAVAGPGARLDVRHFGKPYAAAYETAEELLLEQARELGVEGVGVAEAIGPRAHGVNSPAGGEEGGAQGGRPGPTGGERGRPGSGPGARAPAAPARAPHLPEVEHPAVAPCPNARIRDTFAAIYAIGDNPQSDIAGAGSRGRPWTSVLVRTGVFDDASAPNDPSFPADVVVDDVEQAVKAALHRSRAAKWHKHR